MTRSWGYLVRDNIAPAWIGEMGTSLRTADERIWAETLRRSMNGGYADEGLRFTGRQQPVSGS